MLRTGELLETVPGLVVTQHSGDGKANQYFLRGFNLDHGTDLATSVDGIPVNMHTHGHGQGYTDINFVIPELLDRIEYKKGTYYADEGNFSAAGAVDLKYRSSLDDTVLALTRGRGLVCARPARRFNESRRRRPALRTRLRRHRRPVGSAREPAPRERVGEVLARRARRRLCADRVRLRRQLGLHRPDSGARRRFRVVRPLRLRRSHRRWRVERYALNFEIAKAARRLEPRGHGLRARLSPRPVLELHLRHRHARTAISSSSSTTARPTACTPKSAATIASAACPDSCASASNPASTTSARSGLYLTEGRVRRSTIREDEVQRLGLGFYAEQQVQATDWLRVIAGLRFDSAEFDVDSDLDANSGSASDNITSPKLSFVFGPWADTEFFINAGRGFHENDARGTTITVDPDRRRDHGRSRQSDGARQRRGSRRAHRPPAVHAARAHRLDAGSRFRTTLRRRCRRHRSESRQRSPWRRTWRVRDAARMAHARCRPRLVARALQRVRSRGQLHSRRRRKRGFGGRRRSSIRAGGLAARVSGTLARRRSSKTTACVPTPPPWSTWRWVTG